MGAGELRRPRQWEEENRKLKQLVADLASTSTSCRTCPQKALTPARRRELVHQVQEMHGVSERRGCAALVVGRSGVRYRSTKPDQAPLRMRICDPAKSQVRYGYFRIYILLRRRLAG